MIGARVLGVWGFGLGASGMGLWVWESVSNP